MIVIEPVTITPAKLISTNIPAPTEAAWDKAKTYAVNEKALFGNHVWQSTAANNIGVQPGTPAADGTAKWQDTGAINQFKMFDKKIGEDWTIGAYASNPVVIDMTVRPSQVVNSVALFGLQASSVDIYMTDPTDGTVFYDHFPLADTAVNDWWDYFFKPFDRKQSLVIGGLPAYGTANIRVVINNPGAEARLGFLAFGQEVSLGTTEYGTSISLENYSLTKTNDFGAQRIVARGSSRVVDYDIKLPTEDTGRVERIIRRLKDTPSVYIGNSAYEVTLAMGIPKSFNENLAHWGLSDCSLEIRSLES